MSNLTMEQAVDLTERINARLGEFGKIATYMPELSPGVVRIAFDEIEAWMARTDYLGEDGVVGQWPVTPDSVQGDPLMDGYHIGYQHGYAEAVRVASPVRDEAEDKRLVTNSAPAEPSIWQLEADPETGRLREVPPWKSSPSNGNGAHAVPVTDESGGDPPALNHGGPALAAAGKAAKAALETIAARQLGKAPAIPRQHADEVEQPAAVIERAVDGPLATPDKPATPPTLSSVAAATLGPEHMVVTPLKVGAKPRTLAEVDGAEKRDKAASHKSPTTKRGTVLPDLAALVKEVQRQAMGGVMPSQAVFNDARPANWATATAHLVRLGISWDDLAKEAGLKPRGR